SEQIIGSPYVPQARVIAKVLKHIKGEKILVFKYKPKKNYRRRRGHRQVYTRLAIERIEIGGD
ncbi:MAG: 50S ribosomal protein L21, partial [bacterium]